MDRPSYPPQPLRAGRRRRGASAGRRSWRVAAVVSVGAHLLAAAILLFLIRARPPNPAPAPTGSVELLMVEKRGSGEPTPPPPPAEKPPAPSPAPSPAPQAPAAAESPPAPRDSVDELPPQAAPAPPKPPAEAAQSQAAPSPPPPPPPPTPAEAPVPPEQKQEALVFHLDGTDSESNATAIGPDVIPAEPDNRYRNRPPLYPDQAAVRGEHGTVVVVVHVAANGMAAGVDIGESSGVPALDRAALDAVRRWHFKPAMRDGQAVPFDMPIRFVFEAN